MEGSDIVMPVKGFPPNMTTLKIKLFLKQYIDCEPGVSRAADGTVQLSFRNVEDVQEFIDTSIKSVTWGSDTFNLTYPEQEDGNKGDVHTEQDSASARASGSNRQAPIPLPRQKSSGSNQQPTTVQHIDTMIRQPSAKDVIPPFGRRSREEIERDGHLWRKQLFVTNIPPYMCSDEALHLHFQRFGPNHCRLIRDRKYAFVNYYNHHNAWLAVTEGCNTGPGVFMKITWNNKEVPQRESAGYGPGHHYGQGPHPGFGNFDGPNRNKGQNRRSSADEFPPNHRGGSGNRLARPMSCLDFPQRGQPHGVPVGMRPETNHQQRNQGFYIGDRPPPLMAVPVRDMNPQENINTGRQKQQQKKKKERTEQNGRESSDTLYQNVHCWTDLKKSCPPSGSRCILAQNFDPKADIQTVKMHFESKKRSGGGPVKNIIRMTDGLLVIFENEDAFDSCVNTPNQKVDGTALKIFLKRAPGYYQRKFVIKNVSKETTEYVLKMFLERCTKEETSPVSCIQQPIPGVYLVEYDGDFDIAETDEFISKVSAEALQGNMLLATRLLQSDCLKVTGIPSAASDDEIRLMFQSKKRTNGGPVTKVERFKDGCTLVYFANFEDAERIHNRFKRPSKEVVVIKETAVTVELYHHSLTKEHKEMKKRKAKSSTALQEGDFQSVSNGPAGTLNMIQMKPKCHDKVFFFIKDSKIHQKMMKDRFIGIARVELCNTAKDGAIVKFFPIQEKGKQDAYEKECKKIFEEFIKEYSTKSKKFDKDKLEKARSMNMNPLLDKMANKKSDDDFTVRWQNVTVEVTGLKNVVSSKITDIENAIEYKTVEIPTSEEGRRDMEYCGIIEELRLKFPKASISCDKEKQSVTINGPDGDTQEIQIAALTMATSVRRRKITGLPDCASKYLLDNAAKSQSIIQEHLSANFVKAAFGFDVDEVNVRSRSLEEHKKAIEIIKGMIVVETLPTSGPKADVVRTKPWKRFQQDMRKKEGYGMFLQPNNDIIMVGLQADVRTLRTKIETFLDENAIKRQIIAMQYGQARFILERFKLFQPESPERKALRNCGTTPEQGGGVFLEGTQKNIETAHSIINEMMYGMVTETRVLHEPGIKKYYLQGDGKEVVETTSRLNNCIILLDSPSCSEWVRFNSERTTMPSNNKGSAVDNQAKCLIKAKFGGVALNVWKVDIIQHRCDVIINTSNKELKLLPGGVSGVIRTKDAKNANQIQKEMDKIIRENFGHLSPGMAMITRAGNLPNCKKIVHVVGPRWTDETERRNQPENVLKSCVHASLERTEEAQLNSIAIPAISCGVFGGKPHICIPLIYEAVLDYFKQTTQSCIKKVDFVELSNDNVLNEFKKVIGKTTGAIVSIPISAPKPSPRTLPWTTTNPSTVTLVQGDLAQQQVDVVVNIMAPEHMRDMTRGSTIAKVLAAAAGTSVVTECARKYGRYNEGKVFATTSGSLPCQKIFHGLVGSYGQNSKGIITTIIQQCLQLAAQSNYRSIAFPAIGTGGFRYPSDKVARWMNETISNYATNNMNVSIILYPSNQNAIAAFNAEFHGTPMPTQSGVSSSSVVYGPLTVSVSQGDITQQHVDAIVNSTNSSFDLTQGAISSWILSQGSQQIQRELANASGEIAVTTGGRLPCKQILHLVTPSDENDLQKKIVNILAKADSMNISSIAIPALGTGNIQMDSSKVGLIFRAALQSFVQLYPATQNLSKVDIVIFDSNMMQDFEDALLGDITTKTGKFTKLKKLVDGFIGIFASSAGKESPENILNMYFYASNKNDIQNAFEKIKGETSKVMHQVTIDDPILSSITAMERFEIEEIQKQNSIKIENKSDVYVMRLKVVGLTKDVMKACDSIRSVLQKLSEAKTCVQYIAWEKLNSSEQWTELPARVAHKLEKAYNNQKTRKLGRVQVDEFQYDKIVSQTYDLSTLESQSPQIRRRLKEGESDVLPSSWDAMGSTSLKQVALQPGTAEYNNVLASFTNAGLTIASVQSIERIQSVALYKQYAAKKAEVTEKLQGQKFAVEKELFHGTTSANKIINNGFDRSFAGAHAAMYGDGVYFATTAAYSHGYAQPGPTGVRTMFLASVLTGAYLQGQRGLKTPPPRTGIDLYDSVVDNVNSPSMYIIFKDASAYPTYLLKYT